MFDVQFEDEDKCACNCDVISRNTEWDFLESSLSCQSVYIAD